MTRNDAYFELNLLLGQGRIFRDLRLPGVSAAERAALYVAAVEVLARLHSLDLVSLNLKGFGKGSGYCKRQVGEDVVLCKWKCSGGKELQEVLCVKRWPLGQSSTMPPRPETFLPWTSCLIGWWEICQLRIMRSRLSTEIFDWTIWYFIRQR